MSSWGTVKLLPLGRGENLDKLSKAEGWGQLFLRTLIVENIVHRKRCTQKKTPPQKKTPLYTENVIPKERETHTHTQTSHGKYCTQLSIRYWLFSLSVSLRFQFTCFSHHIKAFHYREMVCFKSACYLLNEGFMLEKIMQYACPYSKGYGGQNSKTKLKYRETKRR